MQCTAICGEMHCKGLVGTTRQCRLCLFATALTCGGLVSGPVTITSPNYPNSYPADASCVWTLLRSGDYITAQFSAFNLEGNNYDTVKIYDGQTLAHT